MRIDYILGTIKNTEEKGAQGKQGYWCVILEQPQGETRRLLIFKWVVVSGMCDLTLHMPIRMSVAPGMPSSPPGSNSWLQHPNNADSETLKWLKWLNESWSHSWEIWIVFAILEFFYFLITRGIEGVNQQFPNISLSVSILPHRFLTLTHFLRDLKSL